MLLYQLPISPNQQMGRDPEVSQPLKSGGFIPLDLISKELVDIWRTKLPGGEADAVNYQQAHRLPRWTLIKVGGGALAYSSEPAILL